MKKLILIALLATITVGCSKSDNNIPDSKINLKGEWRLSSYYEYDPTGASTKYDSWLITSFKFESSTVVMKGDNGTYNGIYVLDGENISITVKDHPELGISGEIERTSLNDYENIRITHMEAGKYKNQWYLVKQ